MKPSRLVRTPLLAAAVLLAACHHPAPEIATQDRAAALAGRPPGAILSHDHDGALYFDERYLDSQAVHPPSARIQRELAIQTQLRRLSLVRRDSANRPEHWASAPPITSDSVFEGVDGGPLRGYANEQARLADIYRKIDSLKVIEHIPLTTHLLSH